MSHRSFMRISIFLLLLSEKAIAFLTSTSPFSQKRHQNKLIQTSSSLPVSISTHLPYISYPDDDYSSDNKKAPSKSTTTTKKKNDDNKDKKPPVKRLYSIKDFERYVTDQTSRIVAVRFHGEWCKKCKEMQPYFYKFATEYGDKILFVDFAVRADTSKYVKDNLKVPGVPYVLIFDGPNAYGGMIDGIALTKPNLSKLEDAIKASI